jgi:hypothetical protein
MHCGASVVLCAAVSMGTRTFSEVSAPGGLTTGAGVWLAQGCDQLVLVQGVGKGMPGERNESDPFSCSGTAATWRQ